MLNIKQVCGGCGKEAVKKTARLAGPGKNGAWRVLGCNYCCVTFWMDRGKLVMGVAGLEEHWCPKANRKFDAEQVGSVSSFRHYTNTGRSKLRFARSKKVRSDLSTKQAKVWR